MKKLMEKWHKRQKRRVRKLFAKWLEPLGLLWWEIDIGYYSDYDRCRQLFTTSNANRDTVMIVDASWKYMEATIDVNLQRTSKTNDKKLEKIIVHELTHILVNEMREKGIKHEERVASTLASAFIWVRGYGHKEGADE